MKTSCGHPLCNPDPDVLHTLETVASGFHYTHDPLTIFSSCNHEVCARVTEILKEVYSGNESQSPQGADALRDN